MRRALFLALCLLCAAFLPHGGGTTAPSADPFVTLLNNMSSGSWKKISGPNQGSATTPHTTKTCANYDGLNPACGGTFANQAAIVTALGAGSNLTAGFSAQSVDVAHRALHMQGGGHPVHNPDDPYLRFDLNDAATSINTGGSGGVWVLPPNGDSASLIPCAGTNGSPSNSGVCTNTLLPSWSNQDCSPENYWMAANGEGYPMPVGTHTYYSGHVVGDVWIATGEFGYANFSCPGSVYGYDEVNKHPVGPFTVKGVTCGPDTCSTNWAYGLNSAMFAVNPQNGLPYTIHSSSFNLVYWSNPLDATIAPHHVVTDNGTIRINAGDLPADLVFIPDPNHAGNQCLIQIRNVNSTLEWNGYCNIKSDNSTTPNGLQGTFVSIPSVMTTNNTQSYYYDSVGDDLWMTGPISTPGAFIYKIKTNTNRLLWTITEVTNASTPGDTPSKNPAESGQDLPTVGIINTTAGPALIYADNMDCWVYKP